MWIRSLPLNTEKIRHCRYSGDGTLSKVWHREQIKAEVRMRGVTLTQLALDNDLPENAVRRALLGRHQQAELLLAKFLEVPVWELFPGRWAKGAETPIRISRPKVRRKSPSRHCQKLENV